MSESMSPAPVPPPRAPTLIDRTALWVHTPESIGRAVIAEALRLRATAGSAPIGVTFTVDELPQPAQESDEGISVPTGSLFQVCVLIGDHHYCMAVHSPITVHHG